MVFDFHFVLEKTFTQSECEGSMESNSSFWYLFTCPSFFKNDSAKKRAHFDENTVLNLMQHKEVEISISKRRFSILNGAFQN